MLSLLKGQSFASPFPHFVSCEVLPAGDLAALLEWLSNQTSWRLAQTNFYEQYELRLDSGSLPPALSSLVSPAGLASLRTDAERFFGVPLSDRSTVSAHKLVPGQRIGIHNDYLPGSETHRVLVQVNAPGESDAGGFLMFFSSSDAKDVSKIFRPMANTAVGFAIGPHSHHAVSMQHRGNRFTLIYSFFAKPSAA